MTAIAGLRFQALLRERPFTPPADSQQAQREEPDRAGDRAGAIIAGYLAQGVNQTDGAPWLPAPPLGLAVLPSILLAGCPHRTADLVVGKRTLAVMLAAHALPSAWRWQPASPHPPWPRPWR